MKVFLEFLGVGGSFGLLVDTDIPPEFESNSSSSSNISTVTNSISEGVSLSFVSDCGVLVVSNVHCVCLLVV